MENDVTKLDQDNRSGVWRMATILLLSTWAKAATVRTLVCSTVAGTARRQISASTGLIYNYIGISFDTTNSGADTLIITKNEPIQ